MEDTKEIESLVDAILCLNQICIDMGESYSELIDLLCHDANIEYDSWSEDPEYENKIMKEAYMDNFKRDVSYMWPEMSEYYSERLSMILYSIAMGDETILSSLEIVANHEKYLNLNGVISSSNNQSLSDTVSQYNIPMIQFAYKVAHEFFRYLDPTFYFISNDCFTVGGVTINEDSEHLLGQYVCHAEINGSYYGFTAAFNEGEIAFYQYKKELSGSVLLMPVHQTEMNIKIPISNYEEHEKVAKKIAEIFNNAASEFTKNIDSIHDDNVLDNSICRRRGGR